MGIIFKLDKRKNNPYNPNDKFELIDSKLPCCRPLMSMIDFVQWMRDHGCRKAEKTSKEHMVSFANLVMFYGVYHLPALAR